MIFGLEYGFMRHALLAGSSIAVASAAVGYFVTLRRQAFAAHALSHVGFTGAAGAILLGVSPYLGLFAFTLAAGIALALAGGRLRERDIGIGMVLMFALGLGVLFLNLYTANAQAAMSILFGSIVGITAGQADLSLAVARHDGYVFIHPAHGFMPETASHCNHAHNHGHDHGHDHAQGHTHAPSPEHAQRSASTALGSRPGDETSAENRPKTLADSDRVTSPSLSAVDPTEGQP